MHLRHVSLPLSPTTPSLTAPSWRSMITLLLAGLLTLSAHAQAKTSDTALPPVTVEQYEAHLHALEGVVANCTARHDTTACNPDLVGQDEQVYTATASRNVHYDWLRDTLKGVAVMSITVKTANDDRKDWFDHLHSASARLAEDEAEATSRAAGTQDVAATSAVARQHLDGILRQREFKHIKKSGALDSAQERFWGWVFRRIGEVLSVGGHMSWLGRILLVLLVLTPFVLLVWWLLQPGRFDRTRSPERDPLSPLAPSVREWQQWLAEAEHFAREERWREAVHHVYWGAISRMEARGLWVADRARTPREYLDLLSRQSALLPDLRVLTRAFERIWYGNRPAQQREYLEACRLMERLEPE